MRRPVYIVAFLVSVFILFAACVPVRAASPVISSLSPTSGISGTPVTISGSGFGSTQGTSTVKFGDWNNGTAPVLTQITNWSDTSIAAVVPSFLTGLSYFQVTVGGVASNRNVSFVLTNPLVYSLMPSMGVVGTTVTVWGTNFGSTQGTSTVTFGGHAAQTSSWSNYSIVALVPTGVANGNVSVQVKVGGVSTSQTFTVSSQPFISFLSTNSAPVDQGVTITGVNFGTSQGSNTVTLNGLLAMASSWSDTSISAAVPSGATTGNVVVTVNGTSSNVVPFMVTPPAQGVGVGFVQGNYSVIAQGNFTQGTSSFTAQCYQGGNGFLNSSIEVPFPVWQNSGDLNLVIASWRDTNPDIEVWSDGVNNQYSLIGDQSQSGNGRQRVAFAPSIVGGSNSILVQFSSTHGCVSAPEVRIAEYRGLSTATGLGALDISATKNSSGSATCDSGFVTTTNQNDVLIGANVAGKTTTASGANYTNRVITAPGGDILEDRIVTATGSYNAAATMSASGSCIMQMFAFKEAQNQAPVVNAGPNQTITLPTTSLILDGTATDDGLPNNTLTISWSKVSGPGTVTFSSPSTATTQATFSASGTYVLQLTANDSQLSTSANVTITVNAEPASLVLSPALAGPDVKGTMQTLTAVLTITNTGAPITGASVQFTVTGPNATSGSATTNSSGIATFSYKGNANGTDTVQATSSGVASNTASVSWITPVQIISTTSILGRFFTEDAAAYSSGTFDTLPTAMPAFTQEFSTINFNPPANTIPGNASNVDVNTRPFTDITTDQNGHYTGTVIAQGNGLQAGVGSLYGFQAVFTGSFTVASAGNVSINVFSDDGFILGVSGGATHVSGAMVNVPTGGLTPFQNYTVVGSYNQGTAPVGNVEVINFPAAGTYSYELDYTECCAGQLSLTMAIGATNSTGAAPTGALSITPTNPASIQTGQVETLTVQATDGSGLAVPNASIFAIVNGANNLFINATTNSNGQATLQYSGTHGGTDTVQAVANISNMSAFSNIVSVPWTLPAGGGGTNFVPQGWIGAPLIGTVVQGQVPINVASGVTLTSGTLIYWPTSNLNAVTVLNANTTGSGTLATFDGTTLPSGGYTIQLTATSSTGSSQVSLIAVVVTGQLKLGRTTETITDLKVPLAGIPISITRTYDSLTRSTVGDFGNGWSLATGVNLTVDAFNNVTFTFNQQNVTFNFAPQSSSAFFAWLLSPVYVPAPGNHGSLSSNGCNALVKVQTNVVCFPDGSAYQPTTFTYTDPAGRVYTLAATGQLQSIKDLNGNTLTFAATGITSSAGGGIVVPFMRDSQNRITKITDLNGNNYLYSYDSPCGNGNLCSVTFPGVNTPAQYTYTGDHNLAAKTDPNGNTTTSTYFATSDYKNGRLHTVTGPSVTGATGGYVTTYDYCFGCGTFPETVVTNPDGGTVTTNYDTFGKPVRVIDPLNRITSYIYDANENLISMTDPLQNPPTKYTYDSNGFQTSVQDPLGHTSHKTYNQFGGVTSATDAANTNTQTLTYDANFNLKLVTDLLNGPNSPVFSGTYDTLGNLLTGTDANNKTTQYAYDPRGNLTQVTDPLNEITYLGYDAMDRLISKTDPLNNLTKFTYDALGNLKTKVDAQKNVTSYQYDNNGNKKSETDALQRSTYFQYDNLNRLTQITYPTAPTTTRQFTYDFRNNKLTEVDQSGRVTNYVPDLAGQLQSVTQAYGTVDAGTVSYTYDLDGQRKTVKDERVNQTTYNYDAAERLISIQDPTTNPATIYGYDADNRRTSVQDPNTNTTTFSYYPRNWLKTITYPATSTQPITTTQYTYDGMGRVLTTTDQAGQVTTNVYDAVGRLSSVTDAQTNKTQYFYDLASNLQFVQDADLHVTSYQYDPLNRLAVRMLPLNNLSEVYTYDAVGNPFSKKDFNGRTTTYNYDNVNRLLQKIPDASLSQPTITFTYTPTGQRLSMTDPSGITNYTSYDNRDRLKTEAKPEGTLNYTYDAHSNVLTITSSNTNGASMTYTYDVLNRLASAKDNRLAAQGGSTTPTTYSYDPASNLSGYGYPSTVQAGNTFDTLNRLTQTCVATSSPACSASQKLASYAYTLGLAGNRGAVAELSGRAVSYGYDNDYHLRSETITGDPGSNNGAANYTYDFVGNRLTLTSTIPSLLGSISYSYDANDRLSTDTYDNNGNTTSSGGITNTYDFENHILSHGAVTMVYDGDGRRASETVGGATTKFLVDNNNPTGYPQVLDEIVNGSVTRTYAYGLNRISENQLANGAWVPSFYGYDGHGNARFLTNLAGAITDGYDYDAFGMPIRTSGTTPNQFLFSGERYDSSVGLYDLRTRYYNPAIGRFWSMDRYPGRRSQPSMLHKYAYTANNPVNLTDPWGMDAPEEEGAILEGELEQAQNSVKTILKYQKQSQGPGYRISTQGTEDYFDEVLDKFIQLYNAK
jgi:RHS repeat-associated protein